MVDISDDCPCVLNETDMFSEMDKQIELEEGYWEDIYPLNNVSSDGPIEFKISGLPSQFIDLNNTFIHVQVKIVNSTSEAELNESDDVAPINNWLHSLFSDITLSISNTQVEGGDHHYAFKAYLQNLLIMNKNTKTTQMQASGWYEDTSGKFDNGGDQNTGYKKRKELVQGSKVCDMSGPLLLDTALQNRFILPNTPLEIKFLKSKAEFQSIIKTASTVNSRATGLKIKFTKAVLYVRRVISAPSKILEIENQLESQNAIIPIQRTRIITYTIAKGSTSSNKESIFHGMMPKAIFIGLVSNSAYNGTYTSNPFNFQDFKLNKIAVYKGGIPFPCRAYEPDFQNKQFSREYISLLQTLDMFNKSEENGITMDEWANGNTIYGFNLTPNLTVAGMSQIARDGSIRIEMQFNQSLNEAVNVIVMGIFDGKIQITKMRNVTVDWQT